MAMTVIGVQAFQTSSTENELPCCRRGRWTAEESDAYEVAPQAAAIQLLETYDSSGDACPARPFTPDAAHPRLVDLNAKQFLCHLSLCAVSIRAAFRRNGIGAEN